MTPAYSRPPTRTAQRPRRRPASRGTLSSAAPPMCNTSAGKHRRSSTDRARRALTGTGVESLGNMRFWNGCRDVEIGHAHHSALIAGSPRCRVLVEARLFVWCRADFSWPSSAGEPRLPIVSCRQFITCRADRASLLIISQSTCSSSKAARSLLCQAPMDTMTFALLTALAVLTGLYMARHIFD